MMDADPHKQLLAALGRIASGMFVITARRGDAETGMLASWVQQCSFDPPQISVALKKGREIANWLPEGAAFIVNILDDTETDMIIHFGRGFSGQEPAFADVEIERLDGSPPILKDALAYLDCRVAGRHATGDHELIIGRIIAGRLLDEGHPMVHIRKSGGHY
ncbi:MAG TPA: flavin reductase family protein [Gemmataceae bacterium]|jgi:flavin reductase (DIM6/NTAB) family NADH-FMN oxidoreductase RutF|nr:flavin reductase family protein [Gemmataceae bacterium]